MYISVNKCSIPNNYVKYWKLLFAKLLDFYVYILNQPVNEQNHFNLENLNLSFQAYVCIFKVIYAI